MSKTFLVKVLKDIGKFKAGLTVRVEHHDHVWGIYWRRRLKDAEIDGCCELVIDKPSPKKKSLDNPENSSTKKADKES